MFRFRLFLLAGVLAMAGACSPSGSASGGARTAASLAASNSGVACAALTAAKASTVLNRSVTLVVDTSDGGGRSNCTYTNSDGAVARAYLVVGPDAIQQY